MKCFKCICEGLQKNWFMKGHRRYKCKSCLYQMTRFSGRGRTPQDKALVLLLHISGVSMNPIGLILGRTGLIGYAAHEGFRRSIPSGLPIRIKMGSPSVF